TRKRVESHHLRFFTERIGEPALRNAACDRHLATFEVRLTTTGTTVTRASHRALVTLTGRLAESGTGTTTDALACSMRTRSRHKVVQSDFLDAFGALLLRRHDLIPRRASLRPSDAPS